MAWDSKRTASVGVSVILSVGLSVALSVMAVAALVIVAPPGASAVAPPVALPVALPVAGCVKTPLAMAAQPSPSRQQHTVRLELNERTGKVTGSAVTQFTPDADTDQLVFRLWPNGGTRNVTAPVANMSKTVTVDGTAVAMKVLNPTTVSVPAALRAGQTVSLGYDFTVQANGERSDRVSVSRGKDGRISAARFGSFIPVVAWEDGVGWNLTPPTNGGAEASMNPTADWDVTVALTGESALAGEATPELSVVGSGEARELVGGGESVNGGTRWIGTALRDWAMSVGRFGGTGARATSMVQLSTKQVAVTVTMSPSLIAGSERPATYLKRVMSALRFMSARYGDYPWSTFSLSITPGLKGGIEYPSHVMQGPGSSGRTTPHEVAHQWFYGLIGNDQGRSPWIDEGLATWAEARSEGTLQAFVAKPVPVAGRNRVGEPMTYWDKNRSAYYRSVYVQTTQALASLGSPDRVDCALRTLVATKAHRVVTSQDVIDALTTQFPDAATKLQKWGIR